MAAPELNHSQLIEAALHKAESAELMASTDYWKELMELLASYEANCLFDLDNYLLKEKYPAREDIVGLSLKWHAFRTVRNLLLENVEEARRVKAKLAEHEYGEM